MRGARWQPGQGICHLLAAGLIAVLYHRPAATAQAVISGGTAAANDLVPPVYAAVEPCGHGPVESHSSTRQAVEASPAAGRGSRDAGGSRE